MKSLRLAVFFALLGLAAGCVVVPATIERDPASPEKVSVTPNEAGEAEAEADADADDSQEAEELEYVKREILGMDLATGELK